MVGLHLVSLVFTLLSIGATAPTTDDCSQLTKKLTADELDQILGGWIMIEGFSNNALYDSILEHTGNNWMTVNTTADNNTLLIVQGMPVQEGPLPSTTEKARCMRPVVNATITDDSSLEIYLNVARTYHKFLHTCPDCLVMFTYNKENDYQALHIYGRNKTIAASDLETIRKQAACLQFPQPAKFHYDPSKELCPM